MGNDISYLGAGLDGFMTGAVRMMQFKDRRDERAYQREQMAQRNQQVADEKQFLLGQKKAARDVYTLGAIMKMEPGTDVTPAWLPVLNRSYPQYPDFKNVKRTADGVDINASGEFTIADGERTSQLSISEKQLADMFNSQLSSLDTEGLEMYGKLAKAFGVDAISPTQRASAISNLIDIKRRSAGEADNLGDFDESEKLWGEIKTLSGEYEKLLGIKSAATANPQQKRAMENYIANYEEFSAGGGWGRFVGGAGGTNDRGIDEGEMTRLDELWALTGSAQDAATHRTGKELPPTFTEEPAGQEVQPAPQAAPQPTAARRPAEAPVEAAPGEEAAPALPQLPAGMVRVQLPDGRTAAIPAAKVTSYMAAGAKVIQK